MDLPALSTAPASRRTLRAVAEELVPERARSLARRAIQRRYGDRVVTYRELSGRDDVQTWQFDRARTVTFDEPAFSDELPVEIERLLGTHRCHRPFVLEVPDVELIGDPGLKRTADGRFAVFDYWRHRTTDAEGVLASDAVESLSYGTWPFRAGHSSDLPVFDHAVPLVRRHARNYSHWTEECLAQLEGLEHYVEETGERPTIVVPRDPPSFVPRSLEVLGYDEDEWVEWSGKRARIRRAVLPSIRRASCDTCHGYFRMPSAVQWLQRRVLDAVPDLDDAEDGRRILITRADAAERRIVNREAVQRALGEFGFEPLVLSEIDFAEQKRLFAGADAIVGTHGAGLTELVYAEDAAVLELTGSYFVPVYYEMAQALGLDYGCLRCADDGDDIVVDTDELLDALEALGVVDASERSSRV